MNNRRLRRLGIVEIQINQNNINNNANDNARNQLDILREKNAGILQRLFDNELKGRDYSEDLNEYKIYVCSICLDNLANSQISKLECKHIFHTHCLRDWFFKDVLKPKCPNCNHPVIENPNESQTILINPNPNREHISVLMNANNNHADETTNQVSVLMNPVRVVVNRANQNNQNNQNENI
jgi:hypothetical protein